MNTKYLTVQTPAKINLLLEIKGKRQDGFHEIQSIMQAVSLYDILEVSVSEHFSKINKIELTGNSPEIPYDENNIVYKACELFFAHTQTQNKRVSVNIRKNIPVSAGLAGGSSNAAGVVYALNNIFNNILSDELVHNILAKLGSDLNFCYEGGTKIATSRGEQLQDLQTPDLNIVIVKPKNISISAKQAYVSYSELAEKPVKKNFDKLKLSISNADYSKIPALLNNDLEKGILNSYKEVRDVREFLVDRGCQAALMSGSGPSVFGIYKNKPDLSDIAELNDLFFVKTISYGVKII